METYSGPVGRSPVSRVAFSSLIGTTIEWYDYYIFGSAAVLVLNSQFFPNLDPVAGVLAALAAFAVAFIARPIGGAVFGHLGDRVGRKTMLVYSIVLMGAATFVVGLLPTYAVVGIWAPVLLVVLRFAQGFAVGGEWGGAVLMALEHAPPRRRAFYASFPQSGVPVGLVLSSGAFYLVQLLGQRQFETWGWRLPFLGSLVLVVVGLYVRLRLSETPEFREFESRGLTVRFPIAEVLRRSKRQLLVGMFSLAASNMIFWLASVYFLSYGTGIGVARGTIFLALIVAALIQALVIPLVALGADRYGRHTVMVAGAGAVAVVAFPVFALLSTGRTWAVFLALVLALPVAHGMSYSAVSSFLSELFPAPVRYTGTALAYQLGGVVTSAPVPLVATYLYQRTHSTTGISLMLLLGAVVTIVATLLAHPTGSRSPEATHTADPAAASPG